MNKYNKRPNIEINGWIIEGWNDILRALQTKAAKTIVIDCYSGVLYNELKDVFKKLRHDVFIDTAELFKTEKEIRGLTAKILTEDVLFGHITHLSLIDYFDEKKLLTQRSYIENNVSEIKIIFGYGASLVSGGDILIYGDMLRWEIQQRMRQGSVNGLGVFNCHEPISIQYKRGFFNDWKILDQHKQTMFDKVDLWLDTTIMEQPRMIDKETFFAVMEKTATSPFRVVPFFDPAPWGGQWMKEVCGLDLEKINYGWCFDCVPEENSLLFLINGLEYEMPAVNLVYFKSENLLGERIVARFGKEFPIRFDLLDTIDGSNLSLQVHPTIEFAKNNFGIHYTQDESYYLVDAKEDAVVYLGVKCGIDKVEMLEELERAKDEKGFAFDADKYVNKIHAKKHDHFLIPAGTIHCSGKNSVVLEISATPNLFTFKLWDWDRLGLDGKPRPLNIDRGKEVIQWNRNTEFTNEQLVNKFEILAKGDGWVEESTGLHPTQFIETRRHSFSKPVLHKTHDSVNVLNLVEGKEIIVESVDGLFDPLVVHYAETFIIPESVKEYIIRPHGLSEGKECKTIKAFVRSACQCK